MNYKLLAATASALCVLFAHTAQAKSSNIPEFCPGIKAIQASAGNLKVEHDDSDGGVWFAYQNNNFDTPDRWSFIIGEVKANDESEAFNKILSSLSGLVLTKGPIYNREFGFTECDYETTDGLRGAAINPVVIPDLTKLSKIIK